MIPKLCAWCGQVIEKSVGCQKYHTAGEIGNTCADQASLRNKKTYRKNNYTKEQAKTKNQLKELRNLLMSLLSDKYDLFLDDLRNRIKNKVKAEKTNITVWAKPGNPISDKRQTEIMRLRNEGKTITEITQTVKVCPETARKYLQQFTLQGLIIPVKRKRFWTKSHKEEILKQIDKIEMMRSAYLSRGQIADVLGVSKSYLDTVLRNYYSQDKKTA